MRNIVPPDVDDKKIFRDEVNARRAKSRTILKSVQSRIFHQYDRFKASTRKLENLRRLRFAKEQAKVLINCYESPTAEVVRLKQQLLNTIASGICGYCGYSDSNELDHYFPKSTFPHLAIYALNLIPSCTRCNRDFKGTQLKKNGSRLFLNPYVDLLPRRPFLTVDFQIAQRVPLAIFKVQRTTGMASSIFELIQRHFRELDLPERFRRKATARLSEDWGGLDVILRKAGPTAVRNELRSRYQMHRQRGGNNFWESALYKALERSPQYCRLEFDRPI